MNTRKNQLGFTLIELMIVVVLIGIVAVIGGPSLKNANKNTLLNAKAKEFVQAIQFARSEAIRVNGTVSIETQNADGKNFSSTLVICTGTSSCDAENTIRETDIGESVINILSDATKRISFNSRGRLTPKGTAEFGICMDVENNPNIDRKYITVSATGRPDLRDFDEDKHNGDLCE